MNQTIIFICAFCALHLCASAQNKGFVTVHDLSLLCEMDSTSFAHYVEPNGFQLGQNRQVNECAFLGFFSEKSEVTGVYNKVSLLRCSNRTMAMFMSTNRDYFVQLKKTFTADGFRFTGKSTGPNGHPQYNNFAKGNHHIRYSARIEMNIPSYTIQYWIDKAGAMPFDPPSLEFN